MVMFFRPDKDRTGGAYCMINTDGAIHILPTRTKEDVSNVGFDPNKVAMYYDETRTASTDMKFQPKAFALQTIDHCSNSGQIFLR